MMTIQVELQVVIAFAELSNSHHGGYCSYLLARKNGHIVKHKFSAGRYQNKSFEHIASLATAYPLLHINTPSQGDTIPVQLIRHGYNSSIESIQSFIKTYQAGPEEISLHHLYPGYIKIEDRNLETKDHAYFRAAKKLAVAAAKYSYESDFLEPVFLCPTCLQDYDENLARMFAWKCQSDNCALIQL